MTEVELVIDSKIEVDQISIQGSPEQIPADDPNRLLSLKVSGPFRGTVRVAVSLDCACDSLLHNYYIIQRTACTYFRTCLH